MATRDNDSDIDSDDQIDVDVLAALSSVTAESDDLRERHISAALTAYDRADPRRSARIVSLAAAVLLVFGVGATSGWVVRNNNSPAAAQQTVRTVATPEIPCHQLFPSINFIGLATPVSGDVAVFLDTRSTPEAIVLVSPSTCQVLVRYDLSPPVTSN